MVHQHNSADLGHKNRGTQGPTAVVRGIQDDALHNMNLLQQHGNDLQKFLHNNRDTFIGFGAEFRLPHTLESLLLHHPNWRKLKEMLENRLNWEMDEILESDHLAKNEDFICRGNHKSAKTYDTELKKMILKELSQGWMFPLPLSYINTLHHGKLAPVGMNDSQWVELPRWFQRAKA